MLDDLFFDDEYAIDANQDKKTVDPTLHNCAAYLEKPELQRGDKFVGLFNQ